jgi:hypothetical protein
VARLAHARADTPPQRIEVASPSAD